MREFTTIKLSEWEWTLKEELDQWMANIWREVYSFPKVEGGLASRIDKFLNGKFTNPINPKDRLALNDCKDACARQVLEFLILILYLEKPT